MTDKEKRTFNNDVILFFYRGGTVDDDPNMI